MGIARKKAAAKLLRMSNNKAGSIEAALPTQIELELLLRHAESPPFLATYVDNVRVATYSVAEGKLNLGLHLVVLFADAAVSGFRLFRSAAGTDATDLGSLETTPSGSPGVGGQHPNLTWALNSRFVVDTSFSAPGLRPGDLLTIAAQVGDELRPVSRIFITRKAATTEGTAS